MVLLMYGTESYLLGEAYKKKLSECKNPVILDDFTDGSISIMGQQSLFDLFDNTAEDKKCFWHTEMLGANKALEEYLKHPLDGVDLFIWADAVNKNTRLFKTIEKQEFKKLSYESLERFCADYMTGMNGAIEPAAVMELADRTGYFQKESRTDLYDIVREIDKLACLDATITKAMVEQEVPNRYADAYTLARLIMAKNYKELFASIDILSKEKGFSSIATLSLLMRNYRCAYQELFLGSGKFYGVVCRRDITMQELVHYMEILADGIRKVKTGCYNDRNALRITIIQLIGEECYEQKG